jgi:hypothetical protein
MTPILTLTLALCLMPGLARAGGPDVHSGFGARSVSSHAPIIRGGGRGPSTPATRDEIARFIAYATMQREHARLDRAECAGKYYTPSMVRGCETSATQIEMSWQSKIEEYTAALDRLTAATE